MTGPRRSTSGELQAVGRKGNIKANREKNLYIYKTIRNETKLQ